MTTTPLQQPSLTFDQWWDEHGNATTEDVEGLCARAWDAAISDRPAPDPAIDHSAVIAKAYAYLWMFNNEPGTPQRMPPEKIAYEARRLLRDTMTHEQRGQAINALITELSAAAPQSQNPSGEQP